MRYLVDSDWIADYLKGRPQAMQLLNRLAGAGLAVSILSLGEVLEGIIHGYDANRRAHEAGLRNFLRGVDVLPLTRAGAHRFAEIRGDLRRKGKLIGDLDLLIAATAISYRLRLVSRDLHFRRVPGLDLHDEAKTEAST